MDEYLIYIYIYIYIFIYLFYSQFISNRLYSLEFSWPILIIDRQHIHDKTFSGLSLMVKTYYIQDYPENFRGNTVTRTIASDFIMRSIESSLSRREKKTRTKHRRHVLWWEQVAFYELLTWTGLESSSVGTKKKLYGSFWYFSMLYDEVCMLLLLSALRAR